MECPKSVVDAFQFLGTTLDVPENILTEVKKYVCKLYDVKTHVDTLEELRWLFFKRKQVHSEELPPTKATLYQAVLRAHFQLIVWNNDIIPNPELLSPLGYGWCINEDNSYSPVMTINRPAPDSIVSLVKCGCTKSDCKASRCSCAKAIPSLKCTELCECTTSNCRNREEVEQDPINGDIDE